MENNKIVITGASSGIGASFARKAASNGMDVILVARNLKKMESLEKEIRSKYNVSVHIIPTDLAKDEAVSKLIESLKKFSSIEMLVNNAGFAVPHLFSNSDIDKQLEMVRVHITAHMRLTRALLPDMITKNKGSIIFVSSIFAFVPYKKNSTYCASKAFINVFAKVLKRELKGTGVMIQSLNPGGTSTNFHNTEAFHTAKRAQIPESFIMDPEEVVEYSFNHLGKKLIAIPGYKNRLMIRWPLMIAGLLEKKQ